MEFELPAIPAAIVTIIGVLTPYLVALVNSPRWSTGQKRVVAVVGSLVLTGVSLAIYYASSGEPIPDWWQLLLLGLVVSQAIYALLAKPTAKALETATSKHAAE